jgi:hypothetical protein
LRIEPNEKSETGFCALGGRKLPRQIFSFSAGHEHPRIGWLLPSAKWHKTRRTINFKGIEAMLTRFNNEVLSFGPSAVLPQNLNNEWIMILQGLADDFLDTNFDLQECKNPQDIGDPVLIACVYEIARYNNGENVEYSSKELAEKVAIYAIAITMESVNRESNIELEPPNLDNVLSIDRIIAFKDKNPEFVNVLKQACIIRNSEKGWFQNIKEKLLSSDS